MKVVIDTNIFISSFFGGNPKRIIDDWKEGKLTLCLSGEIVEEYTEVLRRIGLENEEELGELLELFRKGYNLLFTRKTPKLSVVKADPDDNKFIECAVKLKAEYIITGDQELERVREYEGIKIVSPKEFLNRVK